MSRFASAADPAAATAQVLNAVLRSCSHEEKSYTGTSGAYSFVTNLIKLLSFAMLGQACDGNLKPGGAMVPVLLVGVLCGRLTRKA